jgi:HSP20 family protein
MAIRDLAPWNWGKNKVTEKREAEHPLSHLQREMNRMFNDFWSGEGYPLSGLERMRLEMPCPALNIKESESEIEIEAEMPGVSEEDIDVSVTHGTLTLRGERKEEKTEQINEAKHRYIERSYGCFQRTVSLPAEVDAKKADAKLKNGMLRLRLPKKRSGTENQRRIMVKRSDASVN